MKNKPKKRAKLNRTIILSKSDKRAFIKSLLTLESEKDQKFLINKIINQDIFETIKYLPSDFVNLMFIDPPYNLYKNFENLRFNKMDSGEYEKWIDSWLAALIRVLKKDASIYFCCDWQNSGAALNVLNKYFIVRNRITWEREKGRGAKSNWKNSSEDIWYCTNSKTYTFNVEKVKVRRNVLAPYKSEGKPKDWNEQGGKRFRDTFPSNIWTDITVPFWSMPENTDHPTQKPEKLLAKIILASSNEEDIVFDPFLGSGTTAVVAKKLNRKFCGVELNQEYCLLAIKRLNLAETNKEIQGFKDGIFWERNSLRYQK